MIQNTFQYLLYKLLHLAIKFTIMKKRTLRTISSERFLALRDNKEVAAIDLHYLANGTVAGTMILIREAQWKEEDIQHLLSQFDEDFLPEVDLAHQTLTYTVIMGDVVGSFEASQKAS